MHDCDRFVVARSAQKALCILEEKVDAVGNCRVGPKQVVEGLVGGRVVRAKEGEYVAEAGFDPNGLVRALRSFCEELGRPLRLVPKKLESGALQGDTVADSREPSVGQVELQARLLVVRGRDLLGGFAIGLHRACLGRLRLGDGEGAQERPAHRGAPLHQAYRRTVRVRCVSYAHRHVGRCVDRCRKRCEEHRSEHHCDESAMSHAPYNIANL
jgi:hypothetical protein